MKVFRSSKSTQRSFKLFSIINSQGIQQTTTELFILKFLCCSNNLMHKITSKTPSIHEIIHVKLFFKNFATIHEIIHLKLFFKKFAKKLYSLMNMRQLHILFNSAKTCHVIVCWFLCFPLNLPDLNLIFFCSDVQNNLRFS